jgi:glycosyltransferase involved in cell wall biosynthesis
LRVVFDHQTFTLQQFGGISRYFCALATELARRPDAWTRIVAPLHFNEYLARMPHDLRCGWRAPYRPKVLRELCRTLSSALFTPLARRMRPDIVHETYYAANPTYSRPARRVLSVFDMTHEKLTDEFSRSDVTAALKKRAVQRADRIICISENTRRDLLAAYPLAEERTVVTYLGYDALHANGRTARELIGTAPYLLHVGARKGYKNFAVLARAFAASAWLKENFRLVCFGSRAFTSAEHDLFAEISLDERHVAHLAGGDDCLAALYEGAAAFVYPSRYEGFGIPPLEAMSLGCPVICGRTSSIPEVVGNAGEYFDPDDVDSLRTAIERVLRDPAHRQALIELGRARCREFSWERCARETHDVYRTLVA